MALGYGHARARLGPPGETHRGHPAAVMRDPQQRPAGSVGRGVVLAGLGLILPWHGAASHPPSLSGAAAEGEGAVCRERGGARSWELIPEVGRQVWVLSRGDEPRAEPPAQGGWAALHPGGTAAKDPVGCAPSERRPRSLPGVHVHAPCLAGATMAVRVLGLGHVVGEQEGWGRGQGASWTGLVCVAGAGAFSWPGVGHRWVPRQRVLRRHRRLLGERAGGGSASALTSAAPGERRAGSGGGRSCTGASSFQRHGAQQASPGRARYSSHLSACRVAMGVLHGDGDVPAVQRGSPAVADGTAVPKSGASWTPQPGGHWPGVTGRVPRWGPSRGFKNNPL